MYHPLPREWLLATNKIEVVFQSATDRKPGHGSGFWVQTESEEIVFVTNRHVVDIEYCDSKYRGQGYSVAEIKILTVKDAEGYSQSIVEADIVWHSDHRVDIAILRNPKVVNSGVSVTPASMDVIGNEDFLRTELDWGDFVSFTSFQPWRDTNSERPILRTGILSSDPLHNYEFEKIKLRDILLLEAFSFAGSSGSPVFANAKGIQVQPPLSGGNFRPGKIIGIMAGHIPIAEADVGLFREHSGLSYCHRSDLLLEMMAGNESLETRPFRSLGAC